MQNKNYQPIIYSIILIVGIFLGKFYILESPKTQNSKLDSILKLVEENYVDGFDISDHEDEILIAIMQELDPHSGYIPKKEQGFIEESLVCDLKNGSNLLSKEDILRQLQEKNVSCKDVTFKILGLSLTSYNIIISILIVYFTTKAYLNYGNNK